MTIKSTTTNADRARSAVDYDANKAKKALIAVNFFVETNRMETFLAVYFITFRGWSAIQIGILSLVSNIVMIIFQTPAGDLLDKSPYKKSLMAISLIVASVTTASVGWTSEFWIVLVIKIIEGLAATVFLPGLLSLLLGICLTKEETPKFIATCEVSNKIGSVLFILGSAIIAHFLYPEIASVFYLLGAGGLVAAFFVMMIPARAINNDRARQSATKPLSDEEIAIIEGIEGIEGKKSTTEATSYCELLKDRNIFFFAVLTFIYHLGNVSVAPLVAQFLAIGNESTAMIFASATMLIFFFVQGITAYLVIYALDYVSPKSLLVLAHFVFPLRCALLAVMVKIWDNKYAICATQILDGIGAGLYDTMIPIVVSKMTGDTGRFGFVFGFIVTTWRLGHGFSLMLGESVLHVSSYEVTFITQGGIGIASLVLLILFVRIPEDKPGLGDASKSPDNQKEISHDESFNDHPKLPSSQSPNKQARRSSIQVGSMNRPVQPPEAKRRASIQAASVYRRNYSSTFDNASETKLINPRTGIALNTLTMQHR